MKITRHRIIEVTEFGRTWFQVQWRPVWWPFWMSCFLNACGKPMQYDDLGIARSDFNKHMLGTYRKVRDAK